MRDALFRELCLPAPLDGAGVLTFTPEPSRSPASVLWVPVLSATGSGLEGACDDEQWGLSAASALTVPLCHMADFPRCL